MHTFDIKGKVAIVTGGANGIGLCIVKSLLKNAVKGVTIVDINQEIGDSVVSDLNAEFGPKKVIFTLADISKKNEFEDAFKNTLEAFDNIDILINNAAILDDVNWERQIDINIKGTVNGVLLAVENYIQTHKSGDDGIIINMSSITVLEQIEIFPIYAATKFAIFGLGQTYGKECHYNRTKVKVVTVLPGSTNTTLQGTGALDRIYSKEYLPMLQYVKHESMQLQEPEHVGNSLIAVLQESSTGSAWVIENSEPPYEIKEIDRTTLSKKD